MENAEADCRAVLARLYLYLDREITAEDCAAIDVHLRRCTSCLHHVGFERDLRELIARKCRQSSMPPGLVERLRERLRQVL